ncbi:MAG: hypothetical protein LAN84_05715 [Acidobacteriia bacterium]|nr:hypothetical protein [Terriglobia bacterium]
MGRQATTVPLVGNLMTCNVYFPYLMELNLAIHSATQILEEERRYPTVAYKVVKEPSSDKPHPLERIADSVDSLAAFQELRDNRGQNPRTVLKGDYRYQFQSSNYKLLVRLLGRIADTDRTPFLEAIATRMNDFPGCQKNERAFYPSWNKCTSEMPLVAEYVIRNGGREVFFEKLKSSPITPGMVILLLQLEDMIALNYSIFSESEYLILKTAVGELEKLALETFLYAKEHSYRAISPEWQQSGFDGGQVSYAIFERCGSIVELCRKAGFLHLESSLMEEVNLEINQDKYVVENFLEKLGFTKPLLTSLNEAERLNHPSASPLELKSSMGHLRSFLEHLHKEGIPRVCAKKKISPPADDKWGTELAFLRVNDVLSRQEEQLVVGLYAVISDEAVHPLIARREYARLSRNVLIEYALLFLRKLEKLQGSACGPR